MMQHTTGSPILADQSTRELRLHAVTYAADNVLMFDFRDPDGGALPPFEAGAHVDIHLPVGIRQYSLANAPAERHRYLLGVKRDVGGAGGSIHMHDKLRVGELVRFGVPRNNFPLHPSAAPAILLGGGIGITPLLAMMAELEAAGRQWKLHYSVRARKDCIRFEGPSFRPGNVMIHIDEEAGGFMDIAAIVDAAAPDAHFYCCGPTPMLDAYRAAAAGRDQQFVHLEYFANEQAPATDGNFSVELARSGRQVGIAPGRTILDALREIGMDLPSSCEQGVCGTCETRVLSGVPDHRDLLLSPEEKAANDVMMICCSGSLTPKLVLDL